MSAAVLALLIGTAAVAQTPIRDPATLYVRARAAQASGAPMDAAAAFARASAAEPGNEVLGSQALQAAVHAGAWPLAASAAARLEAAGKPSIDGLLWTLSDAVKRKRWREARGAAERIGATGGLPFMQLALRAWIAFGAGERDPAKWLGNPANLAAKTYADEHQALMLLATKRRAEGAQAIAAVAQGAAGRSMRLKLAGAARLDKLGDRVGAMALLGGEDEPLRAGRRLLEARRKIPGAVDSAADGLAELFARAAVDLQRERVTPLALSLARLATYLAPDNSETWLVTAELLSADAQLPSAIEALAQVDAADPFGNVARAMRTQLLVRNGAVASALAEARVAATRGLATPVELARYADLLMESKRHAEAAPVYAQAIALREAGSPGADLWLLHLLHGSALEESEQWPQAKAALQAAQRIAPAEPQVLNFLGYAQLERRENLDGAEALIREASRLQPDDASITDSLGWALFRRGKTAEAITVLERAVAADPRQAAIGEHLGDVYWSAGRRVDARYAWSAALLHAEAQEAARLRVKLDTGFAQAVAAP